jgi:hypothetical protein
VRSGLGKGVVLVEGEGGEWVKGVLVEWDIEDVKMD